MAQTPQQRRANAKFAKLNEARMGKSEEQLKLRPKEIPKAPISRVWIGVLCFILIGGLFFDPLARLLGY